jgi:CubicO group peptidase (beta-lactamase class C family)
MLRPPSKQITLRHLLLHASGIGDGQDPLVKAWKADQPAKPPSDSKIVDLFSIPLLFEPGEGYAYGASIYWTDLFLARLLKLPVGGANHDLIFKPLNLTSSTARPQDSTEIRGRLLQMVERQPDSSLAPAEHQAQSFVSNAPDLGKIFAVLLSPKPTLLSKESVELLFTGQFPPSSKQISQLQSFTEGYGAPAGIPPTLKSPPVNWSMAGLIVDSTLSLADLPAGSVTWDGMPNVVWVMNREKGLGMVFATQLLPTGDTKTVEIAQTFFREAWATFG